MSDLSNYIEDVLDAQDAQYTVALQNMTPAQRKTFFDAQRAKIQQNALSLPSNTFQKTYTDLMRNNAGYSSFYYYLGRNRDLNDLGKSLSTINNANISTATLNKQLATRQNEVNEWAYNNKLDTLFVFQILFITILLISVFAYLYKVGIISAPFLGVLAGVLIVIDVFIIANRARYTNIIRDKRYWNRRNFTRYATAEVPPPICPE
jgi:hypothetical protein